MEFHDPIILSRNARPELAERTEVALIRNRDNRGENKLPVMAVVPRPLSEVRESIQVGLNLSAMINNFKGLS